MQTAARQDAASADAAEPSERSARSASATAARAVTVAAVVIGAAASGAAIWLDVVTSAVDPNLPVAPGWTGAFPGLALLLPGALLFWRLPWHPIASVLLGFGLVWCVDATASAWVNYSVLIDPSAPLAEFAFWFYARLGAVLLLPFHLLLLLFPTGRLPRGPWRIVGVLSLVCVTLMPLAAIFAPPGTGSVFGGEGDPRVLALDRPWLTLDLPAETWATVADAVFPVLAAGTVGALAVLVSRWIGADAERRSQLRWFLWAGTIFVADLTIGSMIFAGETGGIAREILSVVVVALLSCAVVVAVARYRLYSIDRLLSWTIVYGLIIAAVVLVDVALIAIVGSVLDDRASALGAVLIVTLLYAPLRERVFALANRLVNGTRGDPYGVVSSLASRLESSADSVEQLADVARAVATAFASGYVRVELDRDDGKRLVAEHGWQRSETITLPLVFRGSPIGAIVMEPGRRPSLSPRDRALLDDVARQAAGAVLATETSTELQRIRARLVSAREEERVRLRRQLHDELGPLLAGVKLQLESAHNLALEHPGAAEELLAFAAEETSHAVSSIRRLVHDLRPPALDDLGLAGALVQQKERFIEETGMRLELDLAIPDDLSAAVEVAAYRIVTGALANIAQHSGARTAWVSIERTPAADARLRIEIADDGRGIAPDTIAGRGLAAQRESALELGGRWTVSDRPGGGTSVCAELPVGEPVSVAELTKQTTGAGA